MKRFICHVCGYPELKEPPWEGGISSSYNICHCCGVEYGYEDDQDTGLLSYREKWINKGSRWFESKYKPQNWEVSNQLKNINLNITSDTRNPKWWDEINGIDKFLEYKKEQVFFVIFDIPTKRSTIHTSNCSFVREESFNIKVLENHKNNGKYIVTNNLYLASNAYEASFCKRCLESANF